MEPKICFLIKAVNYSFEEPVYGHDSSSTTLKTKSLLYQQTAFLTQFPTKTSKMWQTAGTKYMVVEWEFVTTFINWYCFVHFED